jgi:hypothetical protein
MRDVNQTTNEPAAQAETAPRRAWVRPDFSAMDLAETANNGPGQPADFNTSGG